MKNNDEPVVDEKLRVSRRAILKAASAAAAALAVGMPAAAITTPPTTPTEYGPGNPLAESNIYPLLAGWLILTTHGKPSELPVTSTALTNVAGLGTQSAAYLLQFYDDTAYTPAFVQVRTAFQLVAKHFANSTPPYNNGICPDKANTVASIASMPCPVCPVCSSKPMKDDK